MADDGRRAGETAELRRLRRRIDALDRKLVALLNERATLAREAGHAKTAAGRTAVRDAEREREVLLRVTIANEGPMPQADLLAMYRRLFAATRALETRDRDRARRGRTGATSRPDLSGLPRGGWTRFAPAPTGYLHLGHVANAIWVWGVAREVGARVVFRIDDHDQVRSRPEYDAALIEDLAWLGFAADRGPTRHSDDPAPYLDAIERLRKQGLVYGCDCTRTTMAAWAAANGHPWTGPGCPGGCRRRDLDGPALRVAQGGGREAWMDGAVGPCVGDVAGAGDLALRDRDGNWSYPFTVVVDDLREGIDLVVRGRDLLHATPAQIRLGRLLGRPAQPAFVHHPLILRPDGRKLSKSSGDTAVRELRDAGRSAVEVIALAAAASGWDAAESDGQGTASQGARPSFTG